ncbi:MAG: mechanosensitive ion channel domain-containing protein [Sphingobacteriia bacterium]|jgi:small conductance mechanosensitive channel
MDKVTTLSQQVQNWLITFGPKIVSALLVFIVGLTIINWSARVISKTMTQRKVDASLQTFFSSMFSVGLKVLLLITVAGMLGIQTTSFVAIIGALGLAVGLALQGSLANFAGGVLILMFKPFKTGDLIESGGQKGVVLEIQIFNTILLTGDNKTIILANGAVSNNTIINHSKHGSIGVDLSVTIANDQDIAKTKQVVMNVLLENEKVLKSPAPTVFVSKIGGSVTLAIKPFTTTDHFGDVAAEVQEALHHAFIAHNISGPVPTSVVITK